MKRKLKAKISSILERYGYKKIEVIPHCCECENEADHATQQAPGRGLDYWCEDHCPVCNPRVNID